jgi:alanine racemase
LRAVIDTAALRHNLSRVRELAPGCRVNAVIKANAYGHGLVTAARALDGADAFAVARIEEAVTLREAGCRARIVLLEGFDDAPGLEVAAHHSLEPFVHQPFQVELLEAWRGPREIRAWLKVDTGMHRLGFHPREAAAIHTRLAGSPRVSTLGWMTHLANADDRASAATDLQIDAFDRTIAGLSCPQSIANSGGILAWPHSHRDWVRPGIMLYGASPFLTDTGADHGLKPVMTLTSEIMAVKLYGAGDAIGYGGTWVCPEEMAVGVVAIGYGDGYPRHASSGTPVLVNGVRLPLVGRVSMDMITVDLRGCPTTAPGDPVVLWGNGLPVEEVARRAGTIPYELLCGVTQRVHFEEMDGE